MNKIESFKINHNILEPGLYTSRIDGDITTYDIRMKKPNGGNYLENAAMHTIEHLFATFARNSEEKDEVIYFGPMGCRTGFYFLVRNIDPQRVIELVYSAFAFIADYEGEIPGVSAIECGNYLEHDLSGAKAEARAMLPVLKDYKISQLTYKI